MLKWSLVLVIATTNSAMWGFGGIGSGISEVGRVYFLIFLVLLVLSLIMGLSTTHCRSPEPDPEVESAQPDPIRVSEAHWKCGTSVRIERTPGGYK